MRRPSPEPMGLRGRLVCAVVGMVLLGAGGWLTLAEPAERLSDVLVRGLFLCWGLAGLLFPLADPRTHDRWWKASAVLVTAPLVVGLFVIGPLGVLAPELVADPDGGTKWPRTPDRAVTTGWVVVVLELVVVAFLVGDRRRDRRVPRDR
ncbi:hypothetical protein F1C76_02295 [Geodermatophilaceae bacterium NBWT11]|nr:hypothetical protein F1C76_02295 [Geodermatophilaceae bacterium NBWT11]